MYKLKKRRSYLKVALIQKIIFINNNAMIFREKNH